MHNAIQRTINIFIGAIAGLVVAVITIKLEFGFLKGIGDLCIGLYGILLGIIGALAFDYARHIKVERENKKIRDETIALITHEMKTGLTSTGWAIQLILQEYASMIKPDDKKMLEDVVASIHTTVMHSINLLDVSLLDIGKLAISLEQVSLQDVETMFKETIEKYDFGSKQRGITFISDLKLDQTKQVEIDRMRLRIIVENLLENAIQYTADIEKPKKEIKLSIVNTDKQLLIDISDSGIGIPESEKPKIFGEFYRASNARKKLSSGSGIGLYMCHQYVKAHRGTITFDSKEHEGTHFSIKIPLKTEVDTKEFLEKLLVIEKELEKNPHLL